VDVVPTKADGQPLGPRGVQTRQRILEAVGAAIQERGLRGLRLTDIADQVGFKPPAFYQYFADLDEAILALCEEVGDLLPTFEVDADWGGEASGGTRPFVERFFAYWDEHRPLLTARHVAILSGDDRFQHVADEAFRPTAESLQAQIQTAQRDGRVDPDLVPIALGAVLNLMIDVASMSAPALNRYWGAEDATELVEAVSYVFDRVLGIGADGPDGAATPPA
jgi:AcrR family transcriptional regulator